MRVAVDDFQDEGLLVAIGRSKAAVPLSAPSCPFLPDGSAPIKAVQTSGTVSPEQSFMAAAANG
jgi:hypothetical protein